MTTKAKVQGAGVSIIQGGAIAIVMITCGRSVAIIDAQYIGNCVEC